MAKYLSWSPIEGRLFRTSNARCVNLVFALALAFLFPVSAKERHRDCARWALSFPESLTNWALGILTIMAVLLLAFKNAPPISRLQMPYLRYTWHTVLAATVCMSFVVASTVLIVLEFFTPTSDDTIKCDWRRVVWTVTPIVAGTAGAGCLLLLWVAFWVSLNLSSPVDRDKAKESRLSIPPSDNYHNGCLAIRSWLPRLIMNVIWLLGLGAAILFTVRGDVLNGLMSMAGILAVWNNTLLPEWNNSVKGGGQDTLTLNTVGLDCIELNVIGEHSWQTAVFIQPKASIWRRSANRVWYQGRIYALANAHAAATDFKGMAYRPQTYTPASQDPIRMADIVISKTVEVERGLRSALSEADVNNSAHRGAFTALVASIVDEEPWVDIDGQRSRFRALAVAQTLLSHFVKAAGGKMHQRNRKMRRSYHDDEACLCPIHRWSLYHDLKDSAEEEAEYLLGPKVQLPEVDSHQKQFADSLWKEIKDRTVHSQNYNVPLLISMYIIAVHADGATNSSNFDYYPTFDLELVPFDVDDFNKGCCYRTRGQNPPGQPLIDGAASDRNGFSSGYNSDKKICPTNERKKVVPFHPKVICHVGVRILWRAFLVQLAVWLVICLRLLAS